MSTWLILLVMAIVTYATRALPILASWRQPHPWLQRLLRFMPPAIFAALIVPPVVMPGGNLEISPTLWAGLVGAGVAWRPQSMGLTIIAGLGSFVCLNWL